MTGDWVGFASATFAIATMALWMQRLRAVSVPRVRIGWHFAMATAAALGVLGFVLGTSWPGAVAAGVGIFAGVLFLGLRLQSGQAPNRPVVEVGGPILDFVAPDADGKPFELATLHGRPFLLKFFRGHW